MKKVNQLKAGALLSYVNLALSCVIPLLYTPVMLRMLGEAEYGLYSLSNSVISYLSLLTFGIGSAIVRYVTKFRTEEDRDGVNRVVGLFFIIYVALAAIVCLVGLGLMLLSDNVFSKGLTNAEIEKLKILIMIMTFSTAASFLSSVYASVVISYERYIFRKVIDIVGTIVAPILNLLLLYMGNGSIGMACVGLAIQIIYIPINMIYCIKRLNVRPVFGKVSKSFLQELWTFSAFVFLSTIVDLMYWSTDKVLIGSLLGSVAVAVYNVGGVFTSMLQNMSSAISGVFTPRVTEMVVKNKSVNEISNLLIRVGRIQYLIISLILSGFIVFGMPFIHFWSGDAYLDAYWVALVTMIPLAIPLIQNIAYSTIVAQNKHHFRAIIYGIIAVINLVSTYLVLPYWGIIGAAVCTGVAFVLGNGIIMNIYYYHITKLDIPLFWKHIFKLSIVPCVMAVFGCVIVNRIIVQDSLVKLLLEIIIYTVLFGFGSWKFSMNEYEKEIVGELIRRTKIVK